MAKKGVKKKFEERKGCNEISPPANDKRSVRMRKSGSTGKPGPSIYAKSGSTKGDRERRSMKRKSSDEVDGSCSSLKSPKVDGSVDTVDGCKANRNHKRSSNVIDKDSKKKKIPGEKEKCGILIDNTGTGNKKQMNSHWKEKNKSESEFVIANERQTTFTSGRNTSHKQGIMQKKKKVMKKPIADPANESGLVTSKVMDNSDPLAILMMMEGCSASPQPSQGNLVIHKTNIKQVISSKVNRNRDHQVDSDKRNRSQNKLTNVSGHKKKKNISGDKEKIQIQPNDTDKKKISKHVKCCPKEKNKSESAFAKEKNKQQTTHALGKDTIGKHTTKQTKKKVLKIPKSEAGPSTSKSTDPSDPFAILMMMEGRSTSQPVSGNLMGPGPVRKRDTRCIAGSSRDHGMESDGSDELSDWEDVQDHPMLDSTSKSQLPDKPVEITMDLPDIFKKKKKKKAFDWKVYFEQRMRRFQKDVAANLHKAHLLCLLAHGIRQNTILSDPTLSAIILSIAPQNFVRKSGASEEKQVETLMTWYRKKFPLDHVTHASQSYTVSVATMVKAISKTCISDARIWVFVFISLLRTLGFKVRLILSFQPMPFKPDQIKNRQTPSSKGKQASKCKASGKAKGKVKKEPVSGIKKIEHNEMSSKSASSSSSPSKSLLASSSSKSKHLKSAPKTTSSSTKSSSSSSSSSSKPKRTLSARKSKEEAKLKNRQNFKDEETDDIFTDEEAMSGGEKKETKKKAPAKKVVKEKELIDDSDSEFEASPSFHLKKDLKIKSNRKVLSVSSDDDEHGTVTKAHDFWMELYVSDKRKWLCFDCFKVQFGKPYSLELFATQPLSYVVGYKKDNSFKDVTARYAKQWLSQTRKLRVDADWVSNTFSFFELSSYDERIMEEDDIKSQLLVRPMPTSIGDFKSHPLYALKRHLLKFEAIYPETAIPLGYIRTEPIYARECVRLLHSRDNWLKEGRLVRLKEEPYKRVKSRPKWNKPKENPDELDLELFGNWQTEKYIPPPAVNGKVPRNDYGNVELFQPWMLPQGTVHLQVQGLQKVAKKLGIDVAPAMIGWDYHSGYSHPVMDGWVVCEEFADTVLEAWDEDQEIQRQREEEKRDKRVYGNWRRLIRGLLIKENLKNKFLKEKTLISAASQELHEEEDELHFSDAEPAVPAEQFWPRNRLEEENTEHKEKIQEYKTQLNKEREKRRLQTMTYSDDEDDEEVSAAKAKNNQGPPGKKNSKVTNKSNPNQKKAIKLEINKTQGLKFQTLNLSDEEEDDNDNIITKEDDGDGNHKVEVLHKVSKKLPKKRVKDEEEEDVDEMYMPSGHSKRRCKQAPECSTGELTKRVTRSRQRCS